MILFVAFAWSIVTLPTNMFGGKHRLFVQICKGSPTRMRGLECSNGICFGLASGTCNTCSPSNQQLCTVLQMPQEATTSMSNRLTASEIDELTKAALNSFFSVSHTDVYDTSRFNPVQSQSVKRIAWVQAFEPTPTALAHKINGSIRVSNNEINAGKTGYARAPRFT